MASFDSSWRTVTEWECVEPTGDEAGVAELKGHF